MTEKGVGFIPGEDKQQNAGRQEEQAPSEPRRRTEKRPSWPRRVARALGDFLYSVGFAGEYISLQVFRVVSSAASFIAQMLGFVLRALGRWLWGLLKALGRELAAPFVRFAKTRRKLRRVRQRAEQKSDEKLPAPTFMGLRIKSSLQLVVNIVAFVLPAAAAAALIFTVYSVAGMNYALAVEVNGQVLGYVADQSVVEGAKGLLRDRIKLAGNQEVTDWQLNPSYSIARASTFTTTHQLANEILLTSSQDPSDIVEATGFYLDGELYAVTTEGERLQRYLDTLLAGYQATAPADATVSFVQEVVCEPNSGDIFFASSVEEYDELIERLEQNVSEEYSIQADGVATLAEMASDNHLTLEILLARNPDYQEEDDEFVPEEGSTLLIRYAQPLLQVQTVLRVKSVESIPFNVVEQESDQYLKGVSLVAQQGVEGEQEVWDNYIYINGELDSRERLDELTVVLSEPVDQIVEVGTKEPEDTLATITGDFTSGAGGFMFPVPGSPYSSRGISAYHRGMDINAPGGMPIYACEGGVVVEAGWHYSFGNYIKIDHGNGITTLYAHCSALFVSAGQTVSKGTHIGAVGSTGNSSGNHCHLEVTVNGQLVDPVLFVGYPY